MEGEIDREPADRVGCLEREICDPCGVGKFVAVKKRVTTGLEVLLDVDRLGGESDLLACELLAKADLRRSFGKRQGEGRPAHNDRRRRWVVAQGDDMGHFDVAAIGRLDEEVETFVQDRLDRFEGHLDLDHGGDIGILKKRDGADLQVTSVQDRDFVLGRWIRGDDVAKASLLIGSDAAERQALLSSFDKKAGRHIRRGLAVFKQDAASDLVAPLLGGLGCKRCRHVSPSSRPVAQRKRVLRGLRRS